MIEGGIISDKYWDNPNEYWNDQNEYWDDEWDNYDYPGLRGRNLWTWEATKGKAKSKHSDNTPNKQKQDIDKARGLKEQLLSSNSKVSEQNTEQKTLKPLVTNANETGSSNQPKETSAESVNTLTINTSLKITDKKTLQSKKNSSAYIQTNVTWFEQLRKYHDYSEINLWINKGTYINILKGNTVYFLLGNKDKFLCGKGILKFRDNLKVGEAWNKFGRANGAISLPEFIKATGYKDSSGIINCLILVDFVFLDKSEFTPVPSSLLLTNEQVAYVGNDSRDLTLSNTPDIGLFSLVNSDSNYVRNLVKERRGQSSFRNKVMTAYSFSCAITKENCVEVLEAAHIQPYINEYSNHIQNGISLRMDLHKLFDSGLITIDSSYSVLVSTKLRNTGYWQLMEKKLTFQ